MIQYNLLWAFIYELNNPEIFNIIINILDPIINSYHFDEDIANKLISYLVRENMM